MAVDLPRGSRAPLGRHGSSFAPGTVQALDMCLLTEYLEEEREMGKVCPEG